MCEGRERRKRRCEDLRKGEADCNIERRVKEGRGEKRGKSRGPNVCMGRWGGRECRGVIGCECKREGRKENKGNEWIDEYYLMRTVSGGCGRKSAVRSVPVCYRYAFQHALQILSHAMIGTEGQNLIGLGR